MADFTDYLENLVLDWAFDNVSATRPTAWWVGLFYTTPTADDGTGGTECTGSGYSRQAATFTRTGGTMDLDSAVTFGPAGAAWSTVNGFGIWDSSSGGNMLAFEALTTPRSVGNGDSATFATSALTITLA